MDRASEKQRPWREMFTLVTSTFSVWRVAVGEMIHASTVCGLRSLRRRSFGDLGLGFGKVLALIYTVYRVGDGRTGVETAVINRGDSSS